MTVYFGTMDEGVDHLERNLPIDYPPAIRFSNDTAWQNAEQCAQDSAVADSLAQAHSAFAQGEAQRGARGGQRNRTQTGMM